MTYENAVAQLMALFPGVANALAWKDAIYRAQSGYPDKSAGPGLEFSIAKHWIELAKARCLEVASDQINGLVVREFLRSAESTDSLIVRKQIAKVLFNRLNSLPEGKLLQIFELMAAFQNATGQSLSDYSDELQIVVDELHAKHYLVHRKTGRMHLFSKGVDFDSWTQETKGNVRMTAGDTFNFHGMVGAVQTGVGSVANVQQVAGTEQLLELKKALQEIRVELEKANISVEEREDAHALIENVIAEVEKPKPSRLTIKSFLSGIATVTQMISATSGAYKAAKGALTPFGINLP